MPTIIDSLIIELELDPAKFSRGQRQATDSLRRMEQEADRSARGIGDAGSKGFAVFFANIDKNFGQANKHLADIAAQSRRAGRTIADGGREGAAGVTSLTAAALGAFSAMKALQGLYREVTSTAAGGAAIGRITPEIGARSPWVQQFANAAGIAVNANPQAIMEDLRSLEVDLQTFAKRGELSGRLREMMIGGVPVSQSDTVESLVAKLERNLGAMAPEERAMRSQRYGLSRDFGRFAGTGSRGVDAAMAQTRDRNLTEEQIKQLERLQRAENQVAQAYTHLWQTITADLSRSGLSAALEGLSSLMDGLSHNKTELRLVEVGIGVVATATGVTLVGAIGRLIVSLNALWAVPAWRALVWMAGGAAGGAGLLRFLGPVGAFIAGMAPSSAGNDKEVAAERQLFGEAKKRAGGGGGGSAAEKEAYDFFVSKGWSPAQAAGIVARLHAESGLNPGSVNQTGHRGYAQWDRARWSRFLQMYGGDTSASKQLEYIHWELTHSEAAAGNAIRSAKTPFEAGAAMERYERAGEPAFALGAAQKAQGVFDRHNVGGGQNGQGEFNDRVKNAYWQYNREHPDATLSWGEFLQQLQAARARQQAGATAATTNNDVSNSSTSIGSITVHTQAKDADGIAGSIGGALRRRNVVVNQANTGLE